MLHIHRYTKLLSQEYFSEVEGSNAFWYQDRECKCGKKKGKYIVAE